MEIEEIGKFVLRHACLIKCLLYRRRKVGQILTNFFPTRAWSRNVIADWLAVLLYCQYLSAGKIGRRFIPKLSHTDMSHTIASIVTTL